MYQAVWQHCVNSLEDELPAQQFNTWIKPLQVEAADQVLKLVAPNRFIRDWVADRFMTRIRELVRQQVTDATLDVVVEVGAVSTAPVFRQEMKESAVAVSAVTGGTGGVAKFPVTRKDAPNLVPVPDLEPKRSQGHQPSVPGNASIPVETPAPGLSVGIGAGRVEGVRRRVDVEGGLRHQHGLVSSNTFDNFVEGKSNQLARAAASQIVENPGDAYNPLFLYGGVGLGKTHLMHAVGNALLERKPDAKVVYLHSERFVADMVKALQLNAINEFKMYYRSVDALLIDDIQFFSGKERSQEEFFHTFNALLEGGQQMILTCDRYPKEIAGLEERLKSRFGWGLTVAVEPPELETRVAILLKKAEMESIELPPEAAFFIAQRVRSNVRELEGALKRVIASARFLGRAIDVPLIKDSLRDLLALQDKQVSLDNIQRTVAEYYKIKISDLSSKRRNRAVARPRQVAMTLAKELTNHSLIEIGEAFGGRDHTTVLHAYRKIRELKESDADIREDYKNFLRSLTT